VRNGLSRRRDDRNVQVWYLETGEVVATFIGDAEFEACAVIPDGRTVVAGDVHFLRLEEESSWATHDT
jgi:WD40 repeat protein